MYHMLTVWSRGIIMDGETRDVSSGIAAAARARGRYADNASDHLYDPDRTSCSDHLDDPDRTSCPVRRYARFGDPPIADLVNKTRKGLPEHIASIQVQASRNRQDMGVDVPAELREGEDRAMHPRLREETYSMPLNRGVGA